MMYKFLPIVAVAAEEFMGRSLTATTTAAPAITAEGSGYDTTNNLVRRKAHGYAADSKLIYDLNGGKAQTGFTDATVYFVKAKSEVADNAANTVDAFILMDKASSAADEADIVIGTTQAQTEPVTWSPILGDAKNCGTVGNAAVAEDNTTDPATAAKAANADQVACATKVAADATATPAVVAHSKFKVTAHGLANDDQVRYACGNSATSTKACMGGMTDASHWFITKVTGSDDDITLKATKTATAQLLLADDAANMTQPHAAGVSAHSFRKCGDSWKSITTTAKPAAGSSNFHAMVATVFSAFFYLMM